MKSTAQIQFLGIESVLKAYEMNDVAPWAIYQGNQFLFHDESGEVSEGSTRLREILEMIRTSSNSKAIYTLKVYDDLKEGQKIKSDTPFSGSFNFRMSELEFYNDSEGRINPYPGNTKQSIEELKHLVTALTEKVNDMQAEKDEEDETEKKSSVGAMLGAVLEDPAFIGAIGQAIGAKIVQFINGISLGKGAPVLPMAPGSPAKIAGTSPEPVPVTDPSIDHNQEQLTKMNHAVQIMYQVDPNLGDHLMQLAEIARDNPKKFLGLIAMLNNF